jgi:hypothetical protein
MAVDTRSKRASVLGVGLAAALTLPLSDGTVNTADRPHVSFCYAGLAAADVLDATPDVIVTARHVVRQVNAAR